MVSGALRIRAKNRNCHDGFQSRSPIDCRNNANCGAAAPSCGLLSALPAAEASEAAVRDPAARGIDAVAQIAGPGSGDNLASLDAQECSAARAQHWARKARSACPERAREKPSRELIFSRFRLYRHRR